MARGFTRRDGRTVRRESEWIPFEITQDALGTGTAVLVSVGNAALDLLAPYTIVRTRGVLFMVSDQQIATEDQELSYGHAVVSTQAAAIGVTAVPTPVTDDASDKWYVYETMLGSLQFGTGVGFDSQGGYVYR